MSRLASYIAPLLAAAAAVATPVALAQSGVYTLRSGTVTLALWPRTYRALTSTTRGAYPDTRSLVSIPPGASGGPASSGGTFTFPVAGGQVDPSVLTGSARSRGGIEFNTVSHNTTAGQDSLIQFKLTGFALDLSTAPAVLTATFIGKQTYHDLPIASLAMSGIRHYARSGTLTISGLELKLLANGAQLFNQQAYNDQAHRFRVGQLVGTVSLTGSR